MAEAQRSGSYDSGLQVHRPVQVRPADTSKTQALLHTGWQGSGRPSLRGPRDPGSQAPSPGLQGTFLPGGVPSSSGPAVPAVRWGSPKPCPPQPFLPTETYLDTRERGSSLRFWPASWRPGWRGWPHRCGHQQGRRMGRTPGPLRTPLPANTTAAPGLLPDLTRIPWPRWVILVLALAVGVLTVSCVICVICHRHRHRRRQTPRDSKEAVGLGSACTSTSTHLVQPDVASLEPGPGDPQQWGRLQLSLQYDPGSQEVRVGLKQAADLRPEGSADPYARVSVSTRPECQHETRVHRGTLCPSFEETCCFHVPQAELRGSHLQVQLLDFQRFSAHEPLGQLRVPLGAVDPRHVLERWYQLGPPGAAEPERTRELCLSLRYVPGSGRLAVVVLEARGLSPRLAEPYVKVQLMLNQRKWKRGRTSVRRGSAAPYFNEAFTFRVPFSHIQSVDLVLAVWARGPQLRAQPIGKVLLGPRACGQPLQHWADLLAHARRPIAQWHRLRPAGEVDRILALQPRPRLRAPWASVSPGGAGAAHPGHPKAAP